MTAPDRPGLRPKPPPPEPRSGHGTLDRYFSLSARGSTWRREIVAGASTFLALSYIVVVNPAVLGQAGIPEPPPSSRRRRSAASPPWPWDCGPGSPSPSHPAWR
ncbi:hypothetical protein H4K36_03410 [Streptomyces sp. DHE7-1]|nr:hypothetical protein [Streptomyces sp. DHE7-1]